MALVSSYIKLNYFSNQCIFSSDLDILIYSIIGKNLAKVLIMKKSSAK